MNKLLKNLAMIITIIAGIATIIGVYMQYKENNPIIEIKDITNDKLTDLPKVKGLRAEFYYKDSIVHSLWKLNYDITNIGNKSIIGEGNNKNIIKEGIIFYLPDNYKILEVNSTQDDFHFEFSQENNKVKLKFLQWKPKESLNIILYVEQLNNKEMPTLKTDEREIVNGVVNYASIQNKADKKKSLFDFLPNIMQSILRWIGYIFFGLIIIVMPIIWISELIKYVKYKRWKKSNYWMYKEWIDENIKKGTLNLHFEPIKLPEQYWADYPYPKPIFPSDDFANLTIGVIIVLILTLTPLMIMIKI